MKTDIVLTDLKDNDAQMDLHTQTPVFIREVTAKYIGARRASFKIHGPADVRSFCIRVLKGNSREHFIALFLNGAHQVVSYSIVSIGTANATQVHPREVFQHAILTGAIAVIVAHNHPSGNLEASQEDRAVTRMLVAAGEVVGIQVLDHVIFCDEEFVSLSEQGLLK